MLAQLPSMVYADPIPISIDAFSNPTYALVIVVSEVVAWVIGSEILLKLLQRNVKISRKTAYLAMLVAMVISFLLGVLLWSLLVTKLLL
jgi:prolipoprotein diacylglyceryltransferase